MDFVSKKEECLITHKNIVVKPGTLRVKKGTREECFIPPLYHYRKGASRRQTYIKQRKPHHYIQIE